MLEIVNAQLAGDTELGGDHWVCLLEIDKDGQAWMLPATAPSDLMESELQAHFDAREAGLWEIAQRKQYTSDIYEWLEPRHVLKAFAGVMLDEINALRQQHGLAARTAEQLGDAIKGKLQ